MSAPELLEFSQRFWQSIAGPLTKLAAAAVTFSYALGFALDQAHVLKIASQFNLVPASDTLSERALKLYGVDKIVPIAVILLLIIAAQGTADIFALLGTALPGHLQPKLDAILVANSDRNDLLQILSRNPQTQSLETLDRVIDHGIAKMKEENIALPELTGLQIKETQSKSLADFMKGLGLTTILTALVVPKLVGKFYPLVSRDYACNSLLDRSRISESPIYEGAVGIYADESPRFCFKAGDAPCGRKAISEYRIRPCAPQPWHGTGVSRIVGL